MYCNNGFATGGSQSTFTRKGCAELRGVHSPPHRAPTSDLNATEASKSEARSPPFVGTSLDPEPKKSSGSIEPAFGGFDCVGAPRPPPRSLAPPAARERARGLGPFYSEPPAGASLFPLPPQRTPPGHAHLRRHDLGDARARAHSESARAG